MRNIRSFTGSIGHSVLENVGRVVGRAQEHTPLPVDLLESDEAFLAIFDAPGTQSSDVQVRLDGRTVEVRIDRFREYREGFEMRFPGRGVTLDGKVTLPTDAAVDGDAATATLKAGGTLEIRVPKSDARGTAVEIEDEATETVANEPAEELASDETTEATPSAEEGENKE